MDLSTSYLGLPLRHPLIASASPMTGTVDGIRKLADAGAAAVVMESIFEEQIDLESELVDHLLTHGAESFAEAVTWFPEPDLLYHRPDEYLDVLAEARRQVDIPVIASLNGRTNGGWLQYARKLEQAGASAIELNLHHLPHDPRIPSSSVERQYLDVVQTVKSAVSVPVSVKLSPFFTAPAHFCRQLAVEGKADGLVLFNRFYQPDYDLDKLEVLPTLELSRAAEMRLPMTWIGILFGRVPVDLVLTGGVGSGREVLKALLAGANAVMIASELLRKGPGRIREILAEVESWLVEREYVNLRQMIGSMSQKNVTDPGAFTRANYMKVLHSYRRS